MAVTGYIIEKYNNMASSYTCHRLVDEGQAAGMQMRIVGAQDCYLVGDQVYNHGEALPPVDFVINRYKWGHVKDALNALAGRSYNGKEAFNLYVNKYEQITRLNSDAFFKPKYVLGFYDTPFDELKNELGLPFVAKGLESSMGREIFLIEDEKDWHQLEGNPAKEWLFEEFIASSFGRDLRLFSVRGQAVACMMRQSQNDFRANVALGSKVVPVAIDPNLRQIADDIWQQTHLDFVGIDLLFGKERYCFCEINVMPGLEGIETASGKNIAGMIVETISNDLS